MLAYWNCEVARREVPSYWAQALGGGRCCLGTAPLLYMHKSCCCGLAKIAVNQAVVIAVAGEVRVFPVGKGLRSEMPVKANQRR